MIENIDYKNLKLLTTISNYIINYYTTYVVLFSNYLDSFKQFTPES